jgi:GNAT superfamily N-acetyltransferase
MAGTPPEQLSPEAVKGIAGVLSGGIVTMMVKTTYLEMFARPERVVPLPREGLTVVHARRPTVAYYRFLYDGVGRDYDWPSLKKLSDAELAALLNDPRVEVHVLMAEGVPAGFAELDRRVEGEIELALFGLMPEFIGQGLGRYFLRWAIDRAWSYGPRRFWLHTDTKDHPAALPNYLKAGFAVYKEEVKDRG